MSTGADGGGGLRAGQLVATKFLLEKPLGQGGMGAVWLARHTALKIPCAVKFLHPTVATSASIRARFEREAIAAAQLRSPNVVQILDHGVWEDAPYIAMEFLEGEDLSQRLHRVGRLPARETAAIVAQVSRALMRAHAAGLVHRDLKPANIFLVRDDDREIVKVLDFGIAKVDSALESDAMTKTGALLGTPFYMSPEQAQGAKSLDYRSDLWALAVLIFECVTGALPFRAEAIGEVFMRIMVRPLPVPSQIAPVPPGFDAWWFRAASRDPAGRFQSARELSEALDQALGVTGADGVDLRVHPSSAGGAPPASQSGGVFARSAGPPPSGGSAPTPVGAPAGPRGGPAFGMDATLAPSAAISFAGMRAPSRNRVGFVVATGIAVAAALTVAAFLLVRATTPATSAPATPATAAEAATGSVDVAPAIPVPILPPAAPAPATASASAAPPVPAPQPSASARVAPVSGAPPRRSTAPVQPQPEPSHRGLY